MAKVLYTKEQLRPLGTLSNSLLTTIQLSGISVEPTKEGWEVEVLPNRPDLLSLEGFTRAIRALQGKEVPLEYPVKKSQYKVEVDANMKTIRPYTVCAVVKGLSFTSARLQQLIHVQEKIHHVLGRQRAKFALGIYPLDAIAFPIRFHAKKPADIAFTPLEAERAMTATEILTTHPTGKAYAHLLTGLSLYPVFSDATGRILSLPPLINSAETGRVTEQTTEVFIECSGFHLPSMHLALALLVTSLAEQGGAIYEVEVRYNTTTIRTPRLKPETYMFSLAHANTLLGTGIKESQLKTLCARSGLHYEKGKVSVPAWRADILHEVDIIQVVAAMYGYESITPIMPTISTTGEESAERILQRSLASTLVGAGYQEILTYHFITATEKELWHVPALAAEHAKTEYAFLRPSLLIPAIRTLHANKDVSYPHILFEIGTVVTATGTESTHLCMVSSPANVTQMKQLLDYLAKRFSCSYALEESEMKGSIEGRTATIMHNGKPVGVIGELHPGFLQKAGLKMPVAFCEIDIDFFEKK